MFSNTACLGLTMLGVCNYNPASPEIYFSIGEGVSALAILFLLKQFIGPIEKFRLFIRGWREPIAHWLFYVGMAGVIVSAILPLIPGQAFPLLGYPIFWEILAAGAFIAGIVGFYRGIKKPIIFSKNNHEKYMQKIHDVIARGDEVELGQLAIEIIDSINPIFDAVENINDSISEKHKTNAGIILCFLSDKKFCRLVANKNFYTFHKILERVRKCLGNDSFKITSSRTFVRELIKQSIKSKNSFLGREKEASGLGFMKGFELIFGDYPFLMSAYCPLEAWDYGDKNIKPWQVENYFFILRIALEDCIKKNNFKPMPNPFISPFGNIARLAMSMARRLKCLPENEAHESLAYQILSEVSGGFARIIGILNENKSDPVIKFDPDSYSYLNDSSVYGVIAYGVFKFFEGVSACLAHDQLTDGLVRCLWFDIDDHFGDVEIQKRLFFHLLNKARDNLENYKYPIVSRLIINLIGLLEPESESGEELGSVFANNFRSLIKKNYRKVVAMKPEFAKEMLPNTVHYDKDSNMLVQKWPTGKITTLIPD